MARKVADWLWDNIFDPQGWIDMWKEEWKEWLCVIFVGCSLGFLLGALFV